MNDYYILKDRKPIPTDNIEEWSKFFSSEERIIGKTEIGEVKISTVFLGIDHSFVDKSKPILFETMVFGGENDEYQERYCTYDEAETGHKLICEKIKDKARLFD